MQVDTNNIHTPDKTGFEAGQDTGRDKAGGRRKTPRKAKEVLILTSGNWIIEEGQVSASGKGRAPASPLLLAAYLRNQGHNCHVLMLPSHHETHEFQPDSVVVYAPWFNFHQNGEPAFNKAKEAWPNAQTILVLYDSLPGFEESAMRMCPVIDYAALPNEKEISIGEIIEHGEKRCPGGFGVESGILYRDQNNQPAHDGMRSFAANLGHLPFTGREFEYFLRLNRNWKFDSQTVLYQRGCPLDCTFCTVSCTAQRMRDPEIVAGEIELANRTVGQNRLMTTEVLARSKPLNTLLNALVRRGVKAGGALWGRCELVRDPGLLEQIKAAGFDALALGIEAATPEMRAKIGKDFDNDQLAAALAMAVEADLKVDCSLITGLPWEDRGYYAYMFTLIEILARSENVRNLTVSRLIPHTGLAITQAMVDAGLIASHYTFDDWNNRLSTIIEEYRRTIHLDHQELERYHAQALAKVRKGRTQSSASSQDERKTMAA